MFKDLHQYLKEFSDFESQQDQISYEFIVESLFMLKDSYQCLKEFHDFGSQYSNSPMNSVLIVSSC